MHDDGITAEAVNHARQVVFNTLAHHRRTLLQAEMTEQSELCRHIQITAEHRDALVELLNLFEEFVHQQWIVDQINRFSEDQPID